jgi:hypothetical protein
VNEVASVFQAVLATMLVVVAPVLLVRWLGPGREWGLADMVRFRSETPWPRGVQEEEPVPWKFEMIGRPGYAADAPGCEPARHPASDRRLQPTTTIQLAGRSRPSAS